MVSLHDVSPAHDELIFRAIRHLRGCGADALTLLVVPDFHRDADLRRHPQFCRRLLAELGPRDEIALHGLWHAADTAPASVSGKLAAATLTAGEGEFQALDQREASERIAQGLAILRETLGVHPTGFVAPAWLQNDAVIAALRDHGLRWCEDHLFVYDLQGGAQVLAPALSMASRDPLRRVGSRLTARVGIPLLPQLRTVRLAAHPGDYCHPALVGALGQVLAQWLPSHPPVTPREIWPCTSAS